MPDDWENFYGLDPTDASDASGDVDSDGLTNLEELQQGTDPNDSDSDNDEMSDGWEVSNGLNPLVDNSSDDADGDGLTDVQEYSAGTDPKNSDTDSDGYSDGQEVTAGTDPLDPSSYPGSGSGNGGTKSGCAAGPGGCDWVLAAVFFCVWLLLFSRGRCGPVTERTKAEAKSGK